jgi:formamidopyrimidine-DNA glycosylase
MPELPDLEVYREALEARILGTRLERIRLTSPFLLRSVSPPLEEAHGRQVTGLRRLGKRLVFDLDEDLFLVLHLMIAGRLRWKSLGTAPPKKSGLAAFDFQSGTLILTEAGSKKRASLHLASGLEALTAHDPGGVEPLRVDLAKFRTVLESERHTLKRSLTDPHLFAGIGNAYSDEILHRARLSPFKLSDSLSAEEGERLFQATRTTLEEWTERLKTEVGDGFPEKVTAFRPEMAVHGRYGKPCPDCEAPVQRILYAETEANYCARCQTEGRILADRVLSRLLKKDWPRSLDELERQRDR